MAVMKSLNRWAEARLQTLQQWPIAKLFVTCWVVAATVYTTVWAPLDARRRRQLEDERAGFTYTPALAFEINAGECSLTNVGDRTLAEARLNWRQHMVDLATCHEAVTTVDNPLQPAALSHELRPFETIVSAYGDKRLRGACFSAGEVMVVECRATVHRAADLRPFAQSRYAIAVQGKGNDCQSIEPLLHLIEDSRGGVAHWKDQRFREAWLCLQTDDTDDRFQRLQNELQELIMREKGRGR